MRERNPHLQINELSRTFTFQDQDCPLTTQSTHFVFFTFLAASDSKTFHVCTAQQENVAYHH